MTATPDTATRRAGANSAAPACPAPPLWEPTTVLPTVPLGMTAATAPTTVE